jgi:hypothetical protein
MVTTVHPAGKNYVADKNGKVSRTGLRGKSWAWTRRPPGLTSLIILLDISNGRDPGRTVTPA